MGSERGWLVRRLRLPRILLGLACALGLLGLLGGPAVAARSAIASPTKRFHSEPWLHPEVAAVSRDPDTSSGDIFLTPGNGRAGGLMILNPEGQLVWFHSLAPGRGVNLEVQSYRGQPVLTWWQGHFGGKGQYVIANRSYQVLARVRAGHDDKTDPHDFVITPQGTAWLVATRAVKANLTSVGGPRHGTIWDKLIQKVDIATGKVLWQWDAHRHIPLKAGFAPPQNGFYDAYHLNSIQVLPDGNLLVSARNTWSVYEISTRTGRVLWTLGGKFSNFRVSPGAQFEWQHAAHLVGRSLTVFDDAASPQEEPQSSAKVLGLNISARTARLWRRYVHSPPLLTASQGNAERLANHDVFVGWGAQPEFSEYTRSGRQIFSGTFALGIASYRALRFRWTAHPLRRPAIAASDGTHGTANVWASWNGATNVASWRVLGGASPSSLRPVTRKARYSFETEIRLHRRPPYVAVQALNAHGQVLGTSAPRSLGGGAGSHTARASDGLHVIPFPGTPDAPPSSQVIFSSLAPAQLRSVRVTGSRSGVHRGRLVRLPAGAGTAFVPSRAFSPGEHVAVSAGLASPSAGTASGQPGATRLSFGFEVAIPRAMGYSAAAHASRGRGPTQRIHSEPSLHPPVVSVTSDPDRTSGDIMVTPEHSPQTGPMILNPRGQLLWFLPVSAPGTLDAFNLQVQHYQGRPVLTWWRGNVAGQPFADIVMDSAYRTIAVVHAANGYATDEHEFQITPSGAAYITTFAPVQANLSSVGGPSNGTVMDNAIQEIDIRTGQLLWQWSALGHVPLTDSYVKPSGSGWYQFFHMNSIQQLPDGNLIVSARNTWGVYEIDRATGKIIWTIGGKHPSFRMKRGSRFAWQHDARLSGSTLSLFDDAWGGQQGHQQASQSSAKILSVNQATRTVSLIRRYAHTPPLLTGLEGSVQRLGHHDVFVGWGGAPDFSEYGPHGRQIFNGSFSLGVDSYRARRFPWHAHPLTRPSMALHPGAGGDVKVWASWNGATNVAAWRVRGGPNSRTLRDLGRTGWAGFETAIKLSSQPRFLSVQALNSRGRVLRSSRLNAVPRHLDVFAQRAFVDDSTGDGTVPVGCFTRHTCHVRVRVLAGRSVLAQTALEKVFSGRGALVAFRLSGPGLAALRRARGHHLPVLVTVRDSSGVSARWKVVLVAFSTSGAGPARSLRQSSVLHILGGTEFVAPGGAGGVLAACYALTRCRVRATVSAHGTQIASGGPQSVGVNEVGNVRFQLTPAGSSMLASAPGNQLAARLTLATHGRSASGHVALVSYQ